MWDENIVEINSSSKEAQSTQLDTYSPNQELHWSTVCNLPEKQVIKLKHCNNFGSFQSGANVISNKNLSDEFEDKIRYQVEKNDIFRVS